MEQGQYNQPFLPCSIFPVSGDQCPDCIYIEPPSHDQCSLTLLCGLLLSLLVLIRTTIYTWLDLALTVWPFACLLPLPLHKAPSAPLCFGTQELNTEGSCSACPYQQGSNATGTQHTNSTTNPTTTPQSFTVITSLLCFSSFYNVPPTQGGFLAHPLFFSFPTSFLWESQRAPSEPSWLQENFTAHLLYEHLSESYSPQTSEHGLFCSGDTS